MMTKVAESPIVGVRIPPDWLEEINRICEETGKIKTQVVLEAVGAYLGKSPTAPTASELEAIYTRLAALEKKCSP